MVAEGDVTLLERERDPVRVESGEVVAVVELDAAVRQRTRWWSST
jgi:hypothetical protein